jgi:hypothetical protein
MSPGNWYECTPKIPSPLYRFGAKREHWYAQSFAHEYGGVLEVRRTKLRLTQLVNKHILRNNNPEYTVRRQVTIGPKPLPDYVYIGNDIQGYDKGNVVEGILAEKLFYYVSPDPSPQADWTPRPIVYA